MSREDFNRWFRDDIKSNRKVTVRTLAGKIRPAPEPRICSKCGKPNERLDSDRERCVSCELPPRRRA